MNLLNTNFNSNENMFLSLAFGCRNDVVVFNKFDVNGVAILSFKKYAFEDRLLTLILVYKKTIHANARNFSNVVIFTSNEFHRHYSRGLQLRSFKKCRKNFLQIFRHIMSR